jgi:hypothetical protein
MTKQELISELEQRGYNTDAKATQQDLYTVIRREQLFSDTNRLNAGWARGKYVIATYGATTNPISESSLKPKEYDCDIQRNYPPSDRA